MTMVIMGAATIRITNMITPRWGMIMYTMIMMDVAITNIITTAMIIIMFPIPTMTMDTTIITVQVSCLFKP
jgi:hypothetical protein